MRELTRLCKKFNKLGHAKVVVFRVSRNEYGYKYLVRISRDGDWSKPDDKYCFRDLPSCIDFVQSLFR